MEYIGIDLGTSAMKLLLLDETGRILHTVQKDYPLEFPRPGWSQQDPALWERAMLEGIPELLRHCPEARIAGIGAAGQMHGLVLLDGENRVIRPAILWNDGRTQKQTDYLNETVGKETLLEWTGNIAFAGFTAPKLLWVREQEPENWARIRKVLLPKDYLNFLLTGQFTTDFSDASGTLLLDVRRRRWSEPMLALCGLRPEQLPELHESWDCVGTVRSDLARQLGLPEGVRVAAGAGDNAAAAIGTGTVGHGACNLSLGTSGTLFVSMDRFRVVPGSGIHSFAHADGGYHLLGCMLSAASCNKWLMEDIFRSTDFSSEQRAIAEDRLGRNPVFFLPYLMGERSPINDAGARAMFIGMSMDTRRQDLVQAMLEGVAFGLRDSLEEARKMGIPITRSGLCGGGAKSPLWRRIVCNVMNLPLDLTASEQGPGMGGAMLAMVTCGAYGTVEEVCRTLVRVAETIRPEPELARRYEERYQKFRLLYPACRDLFLKLAI